MADARVILLEPAAPPKPAPGSACNGCGVCCAAEPCPVGIVLTGRARGRCRVLHWDAGSARYRCGAVDAAPPALRALARRWISAGSGCDSTLEARPAGPGSSPDGAGRGGL